MQSLQVNFSEFAMLEKSNQVNRADGLGISTIKKMSIDQIIISTEKDAVVSVRAQKLGIQCLQGIENKKDVLIDYLAFKY